MRVFLITILFLAGAFDTTAAVTAPPDLSPALWPAGELTELSRRNVEQHGQPYSQMEAEKAMVVANTQVLATRAGIEALKQGGTAMDAAATTVFTQIVLQAGAGISFAGQITLLYYEAATGTVHGLDGSFNTVLAETDPLSIPPLSEPSGRAVLVPALTRALEAGHRRFGKLPWAELLQPGIYFADNGFEVDSHLAKIIASRTAALSRFETTEKVFTDSDGGFLKEGAVLKQPVLSQTLKKLAARGTAYLHEGEWAEVFVEAVRADGGKMTMEDMRRYQPVWAEPVKTTFEGYEVYGPGPPSSGGAGVAEALNLFELVDSPQDHYRDSPRALKELYDITQVNDLLGPPMMGPGVPAEILEKYFPGHDLSLSGRAGKSHATLVWQKMHRPEWDEFRRAADDGRKQAADAVREFMEILWLKKPKEEKSGKEPHTSGVLAVDEAGNVVALMHSINSSYFGNGLRVGGISIPDTAAFQQYLISTLQPGSKLPEPDNPVIVLQGGRPFLASSGHGGGLHENAVQGLLNVLRYGMDPASAAKAPVIGKNFEYGEPLRLPAGGRYFPEATLKGAQALGLDLEIVSDPGDQSPVGYRVTLTIDPGSGRIRAGIGQGSNGGASGY